MQKMTFIFKKYFARLKSEENGAVLIIATISIVVFMSLLALCLDIGSAYLSTSQLQKVADASVYSAGRLLPVSVGDINAVNIVKDSAIHYASLNGYNDLVRDNVILGNVVNGKYTDIKVIINKNFEMNFAKTFGVSSIDISRSSKAILSPILRTTGVAPLGLFEDELKTKIANNDLTHIVFKYGKGGGEEGYFGALDLDGVQGGGASDYRRWLAYGYTGESVVGDVLLKENGNMVGPTYNGFSTRYDACTHFGATTGGVGCTSVNFDPYCTRIIKVVIYKYDSESTAIVTGFASFLLENQTEDGFITGSFLRTVGVGSQGSGEIAGSNSDYGSYTLMLTE